MKCAIMQPTYLPWSGYFNLIASVDTFVFLDDVQYERRSWQSRNRILLGGKEHYLTVPVRKAPQTELIKNIRIDNDQQWRANHLQVLEQAYAKSDFGKAVLDVLAPVYLRNQEYLVDLDVELIGVLCSYIHVHTPLLRASSFRCPGKRADHLAAICRAVQCTEYLSPLGSSEYLAADRFVETSGIGLNFQHYAPAIYPQRGAALFVSHLSIVDVLAQRGPDFAHEYISSSVLA